MSLELLLDATRDHLRAALGLESGECDVTPDGRPHPDAGQRFVAVHGGSATQGSVHCMDERYSFAVTVTCRTGDRPADRTRDGGAAELARRVKAAAHMSYDLTARATAANADVVFVEPPAYESMGQPEPKGPDWFWADGGGDDAITGVAVEVRFGRARRITYIAEEST